MVMRPDRFRGRQLDPFVPRGEISTWNDLRRGTGDRYYAFGMMEQVPRSLACRHGHPASCTGLRQPPPGTVGPHQSGSTCFDRPSRRAALGRSGVCPHNIRV